MEIGPVWRSFSRSSLVQTFIVSLCAPACGLLAARKGMAAETSARQKQTQKWRIIVAPLLLRRAWREVLEHFVHALIQILNIFVRVVGECVARVASPDQLFGLGVKEIDDHSADPVSFSCDCSLSKTTASKSPPTPAATKPVIERIQRLLIAGDFHGDNRNVAARVHLGPTFCRQGGINGSLDSIYVEGIFRLNLLPRVSSVLREVCTAIVIGLHLLC